MLRKTFLLEESIEIAPPKPVKNELLSPAIFSSKLELETFN